MVNGAPQSDLLLDMKTNMHVRTSVVSIVATVVALVAILAYYGLDSPRRELLADANRAPSIIVEWHSTKNGERVGHAYTLHGQSRTSFIQSLKEDLDVDYLRGEATIVPMIGLYLLDNRGNVEAFYVIRAARAGGTKSMRNLRELAATGIALPDDSARRLLNGDIRSKWPSPFSFDYVLQD